MNNDFNIIAKEQPTMYFIGVTTGQSSINKVFPLWMDILGRPGVVLEGVDCKIHDQPQAYRQAVAQIKYDPLSLGALVTTHKIDLYNSAKDMFEYFDPYADITGEISSISKLQGRLEGHAKDPITAGLSMDHILGEDYFGRTGGHVMCLGAGGSAVATLLHLINQENNRDRPDRFICINRSKPRLDHMRAMVEQINTDIEVEYIHNSDPRVNDTSMSQLPDGSIVINATGMGKDHPGSPITDEGLFPQNGIAWEFNYRGKLDFMHQASRQSQARNLIVEDGWVYFVHGWSQVIAQVLHFEITPELFEQLDKSASTIR
jgi:shikimate 5-dehydrogenase